MHGKATGVTIQTADWRAPAVILVCGCLIAIVSFGPRSALDFFLTPMPTDDG